MLQNLPEIEDEPLVLDEIQYVPELVPALKRYIDNNRRPGMYVITGSQQWEVMTKLSESLAGRVAILELPNFCVGEIAEAVDTPCWLNQWLKAAGGGIDAGMASLSGRKSNEDSATQRIWRGDFPKCRLCRVK